MTMRRSLVGEWLGLSALSQSTTMSKKLNRSQGEDLSVTCSSRSDLGSTDGWEGSGVQKEKEELVNGPGTFDSTGSPGCLGPQGAS